MNIQKVSHAIDVSVLEYKQEGKQQYKEKNMPTLRISPSIGLLMINALSFHCSLKYAQFPILFTCSLPRLRGLSFITSFEGGNDANAIAPNIVHNEVDPEHLSYGQRRILSDQCTHKNNTASCYVHCELEKQETLDILV